MHEYLTVKELAELLRIKERKVYGLAAAGEIPCSRAMGKLLFPRQAVQDWLAQGRSGFTASEPKERPNVVLGSHDPLLEWALRESGSGLASFFDGSLDGLTRFAAGEGNATGLHLFDPASETWNAAEVAARYERAPVVLVEWAWRQRGLILAGELAGEITGLVDLKGRTVVPRQRDAGSQGLFEHLTKQAGLGANDVQLIEPRRTESDAALAVLEGKAEAAFGLQSLAAQYRLAFVPIVRERFDLLVDRRAWFDPPMQAFLAFCRSQRFRDQLEALPGYDASGFGRVHFNGA